MIFGGATDRIGGKYVFWHWWKFSASVGAIYPEWKLKLYRLL